MPAISFSDDGGFDFAVRCVLTGIGYGMAEPGEVLSTAGGIDPGDLDAWFDAWTALGARCDALGVESAAGGHRRSASEAHLRAANYRFAGFYYVLGTSDPSRHLEAWEAHRASVMAAFAHRLRPPESLTVPWRGAGLPAWLFRADPGTGDGDRPLMMIHNGLGSPLSDTVMTGLADALARGWHALVFDGPGQGAARFVDGLAPVDDWDAVGRAVLDAAIGAGGVDPARVAVAGISDGGYLAARHAAGDARVAALVCDPGVVRPLDGALGGLPDELAEAWRTGGAAGLDEAVARSRDPEVRFAAAKTVEQWPGHTPGVVLARLAAWDLTPRLADLTCPTLVCDPEAAESFPGQSAELVAALGDRATRLAFTTAEGAGLDCEIGAPRLRNQRVFDHLDELFGLTAGPTKGTSHA